MAYVYLQSETPTHDTTGLWTVGYYDPTGKWVPESDHDSIEKAAARVSYLNGRVISPEDDAFKELLNAAAVTYYYLAVHTGVAPGIQVIREKLAAALTRNGREL